MKKYIFITLFMLASLVILLLPLDIITKNNEIDYELIKEAEPTYVYYVSNNQIVGVPIKFDEKNKYELIDAVFKHLTEKSNSVARQYHTKVNLNSKLLSYELRKDDIYLEVTDNFFEIDEEDILFALAQILYTYKELGFDEVYVTNNGKIISQMGDVVMVDGLNELPVNLDVSTTSYDAKIVKITYYYADNSKTFINHIINQNEDELSFTLNKLINFLNKEYKTNVELHSFTKDPYYLTVNLKCAEKDSHIIKQTIGKSLNIKEENIKIEYD